MRNKRQVNSRTNRKKGYRLKTLSAQEARLRSIKGWKTRRLRHHYGAEEPYDIDAYEQRMVAKFATGKELDDPQFKEYIKNLPRSQQQDFLKRVQKAKEIDVARKSRRPQDSSIIRPAEGKDSGYSSTKKERVGSGNIHPDNYQQSEFEIEALRKVKKDVNYQPEVSAHGEFQRTPEAIYKSIRSTFSTVLPGHTRATPLASSSEMSRLAAAVHLSHTGSSVERRRAAAREADKIMSRVAASAQREHTKLQAEQETIKIAKQLGIIEQKRHSTPAVRQKRKGVTPRQMYEESGHTQEGRGFRDSIRRQARFHKEMAGNQVRAVKKGTFTRYLDRQGKATSSKQAAIGVVPNKEWKYKLAMPPSERTIITPHRIEKVEDLPTVDIHPGESRGSLEKRLKNSGFNEQQMDAIHDLQQRSVYEHKLAYDDIKTQFHEGRRDIKGDLLPNEWDQVLSEQLVPKYTGKRTSEFDLGKYGQEQPEKLPEGIQRIEYVERPGITRVQQGPKYKAAKREISPEYQVQTADGGWTPVPKNVYDVVPDQARRMHYNEKKVQVVYVPQGSNKLLKGEKNSMYLRLPTVATKKKTVVGEHLFQVNVDDNTRTGKAFNTIVAGPAKARDVRKKAEIETVLEGDVKHPGAIVDDKSVVGKLRVNEGFKKDVIQELQKRNPQMSEDEANSHIKELLAAGATAAAFSSRKRVREGYVPKVVNKVVSPFGVTAMDVNDAYVRPLYEHAANLKYTAKHPFSSPTGDVGGLEVSSIRHRKHFIDPDTRYSRLLKYRSSQLDRMDNTLQAARLAHGRSGIRGAVARWSSESAMRSAQYGKFSGEGGVLSEAHREASNAINQSQPYIRTREGDFVKGVGAHRKTHIAALDLNKKVDTLNKKYSANEFSLGGPKGRVFPKAARWGTGEFTKNEKGLLIAGSAIAVATGAGYLYHRHQQKKVEEAERIAFYNKILPPAFTSPISTPGKPQITKKLRVPKTGLTEELMVSGNRIPARVFVPMSKKRIALRPMDRGYSKNAPIGKPSIRLTGEASFQGKTRDAFLVDMERASRSGKKRPGKSGKQQLSVLGHKTPFYATIGQRRGLNLSKTNPNRMTQEELDKVIWAHTDGHLTVNPDVKNFYASAGKDMSRYNDTRELQKLNYQFGSREAAAFRDKAENPFTAPRDLIGMESPLFVSPGQAAERSEIIKGLMLAKNEGNQQAIETSKKELDAFDKGRGR